MKVLFVFALLAQTTWATFIISVGTKDGVLTCEDRRLSTNLTKPDGTIEKHPPVDTDKIRQHGAFGFSAVAGDLLGGPGTMPRVEDPPSVGGFNVLLEIDRFFGTHDLRDFDGPAATELGQQLQNALQKRWTIGMPMQLMLTPTRQVELVLYWLDRSGTPRGYHAAVTEDLMSLYSSGTYFFDPSKLTTSEPKATGDGFLVYKRIIGSDQEFDATRRDPMLRPFMPGGYVNASQVDPLSATRVLQKIMRVVSDHTDSVSAESVCLLAPHGQVRNMNEEVAAADKATTLKQTQPKATAPQKVTPATKAK